MQKEQFILLVGKYLNGEATPEESRFVEAWYQSFELEEDVLAQLTAQEKARLKENIRLELMEQIRPAVVRRMVPTWGKYAAAAVVLFAVATTYFVINNKKDGTLNVQAEVDIKAPESNKATIILPNGQRVMLDTVPNGTLIAGIARKTAEGQLVFESNVSNISYLVASNPRNSKAMHITLPDQTEVWLNADTYLEYPTNYNGKDRLVSLKGEAYFEVKHNAAKTFRVTAGDQSIEDVGTAFNVKAYGEEGVVRTTLLEGIVKINNSVSLQPGQQYADNKITDANLEEVMAWKNGSFYFDGRELGTVASELARWYDVEVVFENEAAKKSTVFGGEMGRDLTLNQAIRVLEKLNVHVRLEGKKLVVE